MARERRRGYDTSEHEETTRRSMSSRRSRRIDEDEEEEEDAPRGRSRRGSRDEEEEDTRSTRSRGRAKTYEDEDEDEEDDSPRKSSRRSSSKEKSSAGRKTSGKGWGVVAKKQKEYEDNQRNNYSEFWLAEGESAIVQFQEDEPYCIDGHSVVVGGGRYQFVPCQLLTQRHCIMCDENMTQQWKAVFKIWDSRGDWDKDKRRFKHNKFVEKVWLVGTALAEQIKTYADKKGKPLTELVIEISRSGKGKKSSYNIEAAWDDDMDRPIRPNKDLIKKGSELPELEELFEPPTDEQVTDKYI